MAGSTINTVLIAGDLTDALLNRALAELDYRVARLPDGAREIALVIESTGGDLFATQVFLQHMRSLKEKSGIRFTARVIYAGSSAAMIAAETTHRELHRNGRFGLHRPVIQLRDKYWYTDDAWNRHYSDIVAAYEIHRRLIDEHVMRLSSEQIQEFVRTGELLLRPPDCLICGLAHRTFSKIDETAASLEHPFVHAILINRHVDRIIVTEVKRQIEECLAGEAPAELIALLIDTEVGNNAACMDLARFLMKTKTERHVSFTAVVYSVGSAVALLALASDRIEMYRGGHFSIEPGTKDMLVEPTSCAEFKKQCTAEWDEFLRLTGSLLSLHDRRMPKSSPHRLSLGRRVDVSIAEGADIGWFQEIFP